MWRLNKSSRRYYIYIYIKYTFKSAMLGLEYRLLHLLSRFAGMHIYYFFLSSSSSGASVVAIDNKIEQAMVSLCILIVIKVQASLSLC